MRRALLAAVAGLGILAGFAGCAGSAAGTGDADPARLAPRDAVAYVAVNLGPDDGQRAALERLGRALLGSGDPLASARSGLGPALPRSDMERLAAWEGWIAAMQPWTGRRAALVAFPTGSGRAADALILSLTDSAAAHRALRRRGGRTGTALPPGLAAVVVADRLVVGPESSLHAIVGAAQGQGLDSEPQFARLASGQEHKLVFGYVDLARLLGAAPSLRRVASLATGVLEGGALAAPGPRLRPLPSARALDAALGAHGVPSPLRVSAALVRRFTTLAALRGRSRPSAQVGPFSFSLDARGRQARLQVTQLGVTGAPGFASPTRLRELPADTWFAQGLPRVGESVRLGSDALTPEAEAQLFTLGEELRARTGIDLQRDVVPAVGDVAVFVRGTSPSKIGGGLVIQTPDPAAAQRLLGRLAETARRRGGAEGVTVVPSTVGSASGYRISTSGGTRAPGSEPVNALLQGSRIVIAYGEAATRLALAPVRTLGATADFVAAQRALDGRQPDVYVAFGPLTTLLRSLGDAGARQAARSLGRLETLAGATRVVDGAQSTRVVLTVR